ncbi:hypothetical protein SLEP1_g48574 [Rubroshorea leprosula]|uniref:Uncharacterized protein n=1 Tax=Rubroshorea leprosula TaxID=152421 RepID=A0AAV5LWD1_9ROSI|nr:hypothetical protein SLEP1_g48574 [Rubroshorea leprosula]
MNISTGVLIDEESCLTMYESIFQLLKAENQARLWECKKRNKHGWEMSDKGCKNINMLTSGKVCEIVS